MVIIFGLIVLLTIIAGVVAIAALIISAVVKVKLAKYNSLRLAEQPAKEQEGVWPPPPSV